MNKFGTTILEFLVYLTLCIFITIIAMQGIVQLWCACMHYQKMQSTLITITAAHDLLVRDIYYAPSAKQAWKVHTSDCLIWQQAPTKDIGWLYEKDTLFRIEGIYNESKSIWLKKTKNMVAPFLQKVTFTCHGEKTMQWVDISLMDAYQAINARILLLQGFVPWHIKMDPLPS